MSISAVNPSPAPTPIKPPDASERKPPVVQNDDDDASRTPPPVRAALPPGQGTRIDQLV